MKVDLSYPKKFVCIQSSVYSNEQLSYNEQVALIVNSCNKDRYGENASEISKN